MKKRTLFLGWIALELAALPVAAHIFSQVNFVKPQRTIVVEIDADPGTSTFMVNSNAPFAIIAEGSRGAFEVSVDQTGLINGNRYGENAQLPGKSFTCAKSDSSSPKTIYLAERKTEMSKGPILTRAVRIDVSYDQTTEPKLKVISQNDAQSIPRARPCRSENSIDREARNRIHSTSQIKTQNPSALYPH